MNSRYPFSFFSIVIDLKNAVGAEVAKFGQGTAFRIKWIGKGDGKNALVKQVACPLTQ